MGKELPKNWVESNLKDITSFVIGGDWGKDPSIDLGDEFTEVLCIRGSEIKNWNDDKGNTASLRLIKKASLEKRNLIEGDILIEISGGGPDQPVGRIVYIDKESLEQDKLPKVCTNFLRMLRINDILNKKFVSLFLEHIYLSGEVIKYQGGSNNLRNLKFKEYELIKIPLPPLPEQTRIVAKLDQLFGQLEQIKESLDKIPKLLKDFRQQVLRQAVTGKLTECSSEEKQLGKLLTEVKYGTSKKSEYEIEGTPIFRIPNISDGEIDATDLKYSYLDTNEYEKLKLEVGDVLIIRSNGSISIVGKSAIIRKGHLGFSYAGYLIRLRCSPNLDPEFLNYSLQSNFLRSQIVEKARSTSGVNNINSNEIKELNILIPSKIEEQQEIVTRIETLFDKADTIAQQYQTLKQKIDTLPQAILHKAFKGELVPQLESDGNAWELLEVIKALKKETTKPKKKDVRVSAVEPSKKANRNVRVSPSTSSGQAKVEPLKTSKTYKVDVVELGRVAEEKDNYSKRKIK